MSKKRRSSYEVSNKHTTYVYYNGLKTAPRKSSKCITYVDKELAAKYK